MKELAADTQSADALLTFIDRSPTPWHAAAMAVRRLEEAGFESLDERESWHLRPGHGYYVVRGGSSVVAFRVGAGPISEQGFRIVGAHTDSPGLRLKPQPAATKGRWVALGAEVYGGPILATFADRDLTLAGRLIVREGNARLASRLYWHEQPLLRIPNLAIHMNRTVNEEGLKLDPYTETPALFQFLTETLGPADQFRRWLAESAGVGEEALLSFELGLCDTQAGVRYGPGREFVADGQLDNLSSCHAALEALCDVDDAKATSVCALFDHEEVGSESHAGAGGTLLADVLGRIGEHLGGSSEAARQARARSWLVSADTAHAHQPNFPAYYDDDNTVQVNGGPVIKINAKQRYATNAFGEALFRQVCDQAGVPVQTYVHRANLPCGSTIGPISAARLGVRTIDVGLPIWAMHSIRESGGALDPGYLIRALRQFYRIEDIE